MEEEKDMGGLKEEDRFGAEDAPDFLDIISLKNPLWVAKTGEWV